MPMVEPGTQTREMEFADHIEGSLKNITVYYKAKGKMDSREAPHGNPLQRLTQMFELHGERKTPIKS